MTLQQEAQQFLFGSHKGVLSTHSAKHAGYPYGSVVPYVTNQDGMPTILISTLAEHTKNIIDNPLVSLIAFDHQSDLQANARLTLLAKAEQTNKQNNLLRARYLRYLPQAESYFEAHDFSFYTLHITQARYIAGFGKMGWIEGKDFQIPNNPLFTEENGILEHMNQDHVKNLIAYCQHFHGITPSAVDMIGIDSLGFDMRINETQQLRFNFENAISNAQEARIALVEMAKQCRQ